MNFYGTDVKGIFKHYILEPIDITFCTLWWPQLHSTYPLLRN